MKPATGVMSAGARAKPAIAWGVIDSPAGAAKNSRVPDVERTTTTARASAEHAKNRRMSAGLFSLEPGRVCESFKIKKNHQQQLLFAKTLLNIDFEAVKKCATICYLGKCGEMSIKYLFYYRR